MSGQQPTEPPQARAVRPATQGGQTAPVHGRPKMLVPKRPEIGSWKLNVTKNQGSIAKPKVTFDKLFDKYSKQKAVTSDQPLKKDEVTYASREAPSPPRAATRFRGESSQQGQHFGPSWAPSSSNPPRLIYDENGVMWVPYQQSFHPGWGGPRKPALDRIARLVQDCWAPRQFGQGHQANLVRQPPTRGQTTPSRKFVQSPPKQVYKPKIREEEVWKMDIDAERTTDRDIIQIGTMGVPIEKDGKRPVVLNDQVVTSTPKGSVVANDHEASGSKSHPKYFLPRWCPPGLTHTQRRKLQRLRFREKKEKELEAKRDEMFNSYRPMVPQGKEWRAKTTTAQIEVVKPAEVVVRPALVIRPGDQRLDRPSQRHRPVFLL